MQDALTPGRLETLTGLKIHLPSLVSLDGAQFFMAEGGGSMRMGIWSQRAQPLDAFVGERIRQGDRTLLLCPLHHENAEALRHTLPWLRPQTLGLRTSAGLGDRLGLATPGHVRAVRAAGGNIAPVFAQQSIREMARTGRTPEQVMDDALWGVFREGWREVCGADADHLKTPADIDACVRAGYTFFTIDPGEHVDNAADTAPLPDLRASVRRLPSDLQVPASGLLSKTFEAAGHTLTLDEPTLLRAAAKYGRAVAHVAAMHRHLMGITAGRGCELEVSVDETETATTPADHIYIASELHRLGVQWVSMAPRYVGRFEKGVDYISPSGRIGDATAFEADFAVHAAIARLFGPYKLSLHSGSDKFSIYPAAARLTQGLVHLKTAGTSYLEALHTVASLDPGLFREIYAFARDRYETDRASYHVSARLEAAPLPQGLSERDLPLLLDQFDAREILHVTYGSVLRERTPEGCWRFYDRLMDALRTHPEAYAADLEAHFLRHLRPFAQHACGGGSRA